MSLWDSSEALLAGWLAGEVELPQREPCRLVQAAECRMISLNFNQNLAIFCID
jgi:hypothetical protein